MTKTVFHTQKIFFALGTVNTLTIYDGEGYRALGESFSNPNSSMESGHGGHGFH